MYRAIGEWDVLPCCLDGSMPRLQPVDTPSAAFLNGCGYEVAEPDVNQVHSQSELKANTLHPIHCFQWWPIQNLRCRPKSINREWVVLSCCLNSSVPKIAADRYPS